MNNGNCKVALVSHGCAGFGPAICRSLADKGWTLAIHGTAAESEVAADLAQIAEGAKYFRSEAATKQQCASLVSEVSASLGQISLLVNLLPAGAGSDADILSATTDEFPIAVTEPIKGAFFFTQQVAKAMVSCRDEMPGGLVRILNVYQSKAYEPTMLAAGRRLANAGVRMLTKLWALKLREYDIGVYEVRVPVGDDTVFADDVAALVAALAGGLVPAATGQSLAVGDGADIPQL